MKNVTKAIFGNGWLFHIGGVVNTRHVAARLTGVSDHADATAGKPCCYGRGEMESYFAKYRIPSSSPLNVSGYI